MNERALDVLYLKRLINDGFTESSEIKVRFAFCP